MKKENKNFKRLVTILITITMCLVILPQVNANPDDMVASWHFDEGIGSVVYDETSNDNDGIFSGGKFGNALKFDGLNDYVNIPDDTTLDITGDITLEAWININYFSTSAGLHMYIIGKDSAGQRSYGIGVDLSWQQPKKPFVIMFHSGGSYQITWGSYQLITNQWYHIAGVFDEVNNQLKLYVNGIQQTAQADTSTIYPGTADLRIGGRQYAGAECYFNGLIDEVRISTIVRYSSNFAPQILPFTTDVNTIGLWHFDESVGTTVYDSSSNDNDGTINGAIWVGPTWTTGKVGSGIHFDGADDYIRINDDESLEPETITVECFVKSSNPGIYSHIISKDYTTAFGSSSYALYTGSTGGLYFYIKTAAGYVLSPNAGTGIWNGLWHHVAGTFDGVNLRLYVDGVEITGSPSTVNEILYSTTGNLLVGKYSEVQTHPSYDFCYCGDVDEVRIYDYALSSLVVHAHSHLDYNPPTASAGGPYSGNEGSSITLTGSATDPEGGTLTYNWDLNNDNVFETTGLSATFNCVDNGIYPVNLKVTDEYGLFDTDSINVAVSNVDPTITSVSIPLTPVPISTSISVSALFTDPGVIDTHTSLWNWNDGSTDPGTVTESSGSGSVTGSHAYALPGVYILSLTVTDKDGGTDTYTCSDYIVIYDPSAGFVTGGGWIYSPAGAYIPDPSAQGKANFGFVSKYKKGQSTPSGNTEFQFKAGDLNFHSSSYEWLVIAGAKAMYKGTGTINGAGSYNFMITAWDGQINSGDDTFRIKIWYEENDDEIVIYDNGIDTALSGGQIKIHTS